MFVSSSQHTWLAEIISRSSPERMRWFSLIAAIAIARDLTRATRNTKDFEGFGIDIIDPWTANERSRHLSSER